MKSFKEFVAEQDQLFELHQLVEVLDRPYKLSDISDHIPLENIDKMRDMGFSDMEFHVCDDEPGHAFFTGKKDGAYEVHRQNTTSGEEVHDKNLMVNKVPSKFVSTAFHLIANKVRVGNNVRIVASSDHLDSYHSIAKTVAKRKGFAVTEPVPHEVKDGTLLSSFLVKPIKQFDFEGLNMSKVRDTK